MQSHPKNHKIEIHHCENLKSHMASCPCTFHEGIWGSGSITPLILNLCTRQRRWVVSFMPKPLHHRKKKKTSLLCPQKRRLRWPLCWSWMVCRRFCPCWKSNHASTAVQPIAQSLCLFCYPGCTRIIYISERTVHTVLNGDSTVAQHVFT